MAVWQPVNTPPTPPSFPTKEMEEEHSRQFWFEKLRLTIDFSDLISPSHPSVAKPSKNIIWNQGIQRSPSKTTN